MEVFRVGEMGTSTQFVVFRFVFCCNPKFNEGMVQERSKSPSKGVMLRTGVGVVCEV